MDSPFMYWLIWLVKVAAGVTFVVKIKETRPAILGGIGFGLLILIPLFMGSMLWVEFGLYDYSALFGLLQLGGWGCLVAAFLLLARRDPAAQVTATAVYQQQQVSQPVTSGYQIPPKYYHPSLNKGFYLGSILAGVGASIVLGAIALMLVMDYEEEAAVPLIILAFMASVYSVVILAMLIHRMWTMIQPGHPRTTPGQAVGFLFIPFFNFYWIFQAYYGWAQDYNRYVISNSLPAPRVNEGFALTVSILCVCSIIPYLGILIALVNTVFLGLFLSQACDAIMALATIHDTAASQPPENQ